MPTLFALLIEIFRSLAAFFILAMGTAVDYMCTSYVHFTLLMAYASCLTCHVLPEYLDTIRVVDRFCDRNISSSAQYTLFFGG